MWWISRVSGAPVARVSRRVRVYGPVGVRACGRRRGRSRRPRTAGMPWIRGGAGPRYLLSFGDVAVACGFLFVNIYTAMQRSVRLEAVGRVSGLYVAAFYMGFGLTAIWT